MKVQVTALTSFMHGRIHLHAGDTAELTKGDAEELQKAGMVEIGGSPEQPAQDDMTDVLGDGTKMDGAAENKMDKPAENKATTRSKKAD